MKRVRERELAKQKEMAAAGRRFMGEKKLAKDRWERRATSWEDRVTITPKVAASSRWERLAQLQRNRRWECEDAGRREDLRAGGKPVFPQGTYWLRLHAGVPVATAPP